MISEIIKQSLPTIPSGARIGILGGSFDPPHICHQLLALSMLALESIDALWIIPCADHPFAKNLRAFEHRLAMCNLAFSHFSERVKVVPLEKYLPAPNYTIKTLKTIKAAYPDSRLFLAMGSDIISQIPSWHEPQEISALSTPIVFLREGFPLASMPNELQNARLHRGFVLPDVRSTVMRTRMSESNNLMSDMPLLDQKVLNYIRRHNIYIS